MSAEPTDDYRGPTIIGHYKVRCRGTSYSMDIDGYNIEVWVTEKRRFIRVYVNHQEWGPA